MAKDRVTKYDKSVTLNNTETNFFVFEINRFNCLMACISIRFNIFASCLCF